MCTMDNCLRKKNRQKGPKKIPGKSVWVRGSFRPEIGDGTLSSEIIDGWREPSQRIEYGANPDCGRRYINWMPDSNEICWQNHELFQFQGGRKFLDFDGRRMILRPTRRGFLRVAAFSPEHCLRDIKLSNPSVLSHLQ
jgi:hypothetical protein